MVTIFSLKKSAKSLERLKISDLNESRYKRQQVWVDVNDPSHKDVATLAELFHLHPITIEDIQTQTPSIKYEVFDEYTFVVFTGVKKIAQETTELLQTYTIFFIIGENFLITVHKPEVKTIDKIIDNKNTLTSLLVKGTDTLFHEILDQSIDLYFPLVERLFDDIEDIDEDITKNPAKANFDELFDKKRVTLKIKRLIGPTINVVARLTRPSKNFISEGVMIYFRDIFDNLLRINERLEASLDLVSATVAQHSAVASNKLNDVIKILTIFTVVMMPLTLITGFYGMNVNLPGSNSLYITSGILISMLTIVIFMVFFFHKKKWI